MAAEEVILNLFDVYWFENSIFTRKSPPKTLLENNPVHDIHDNTIQEPNIVSRLTSLLVRSQSDQNLMGHMYDLDSDSSSPNSVLTSTPKLQTILSGKEVLEFPSTGERDEEVNFDEERVRERKKRSRKKKGLSKSLSELEFEEVKGFMDLGFVFSEEDKDSSLVSIIPGLQRLGRKSGETAEGQEEEEEEEEEEKGETVDDQKKSQHVIQRPYLSEAWDILEKRKKPENPILVNWRIPANLGNEMDMKDHLKFWAHTVASTVR